MTFSEFVCICFNKDYKKINNRKIKVTAILSFAQLENFFLRFFSFFFLFLLFIALFSLFKISDMG